ncbi:MAG: hypothetical protein ACLQPD_35715 [Desulfomonilaceae bacterium]
MKAIYQKNEKTAHLSNDNSRQLQALYNNKHTHYPQISFHPSTITTDLLVRLDKQIYSAFFSPKTSPSHLSSVLTQLFGPPNKKKTTVLHRHRVVLTKKNSKIIIYTNPAFSGDPIVIALYKSSRFEASSIKEMFPALLTRITSGTACTSISVKDSKSTMKTVYSLLQELSKRGYHRTGNKDESIFFYQTRQGWRTDSFRITLRLDPVFPNMAPAMIQIDKFKIDEEAYVDCVFLIKTLQSIGIKLKNHEIEWQVIFPGKDESFILDLLKRTSLKSVRKLGYSTAKREDPKNYTIKAKKEELMRATHYIGNERSSIENRIYKKPSMNPKLEIVLRSRFFERAKWTGPEAIFTRNIWDAISKRIVFGSLDIKISKKQKNRAAYEKALRRAEISLQWARQLISKNSSRFIKVDEEFTNRVSNGFSDLWEVLEYVWKVVEPADLDDLPVQKAIGNSTETIFPELSHGKVSEDTQAPREVVAKDFSSPTLQELHYL